MAAEINGYTATKEFKKSKKFTNTCTTQFAVIAVTNYNTCV